QRTICSPHWNSIDDEDLLFLSFPDRALESQFRPPRIEYISDSRSRYILGDVFPDNFVLADAKVVRVSSIDKTNSAIRITKYNAARKAVQYAFQKYSSRTHVFFLGCHIFLNRFSILPY